MNHRILLSDIIIIKKIFFTGKNALVIFDPEAFLHKDDERTPNLSCKTEKALRKLCQDCDINYVLVNLSGENLTYDSFSERLSGIIDFSGLTISRATSHHYINNPDGSMRWIFPSQTRRAGFLALYNSTGIKAFCFKALAKLLGYFFALPLLSAGHFSILKKETSLPLAPWQDNFTFDDYAIFTGTIGENRKAIIAFLQAGQCTHFLKIPMTAAAQQLTNNEAIQLRNLANLPLRSIVVPTSKMIANALLQTNVKRGAARNQLAWTTYHSKALTELYQLTATTQLLERLEFWHKLKRRLSYLKSIEEIKNNIAPQQFRYLIKLCEQQLASINAAVALSVGMAHGDFTPWNMYLGKQKLLVYDWEMSKNALPLGFDLFHYFFQKGILIERKKQDEITDEIKTILQQEAFQELRKQYAIHWGLHYRLYLIFIVSYYLPKYAVQARLHPQAHWLIKHWIKALEQLNLKMETSGAEH